MSLLIDMIQSTISGRKTKKTPSGWTSFNAPCCHNRGHKQDERMRGGLMIAEGGVSYHCFNCGFKTSWQPGRNMSHKMREFLRYLNVGGDDITKIVFAIMRENEGVDSENIKFKLQLPEFDWRPLPKGAVKINDLVNNNPSKELLDVLYYMANRNLNLDDLDYYWSPEKRWRERFIIPFQYRGKQVGSVARLINQENASKYHTDTQPGFVFNIDAQHDKAFTIVCEGIIDAIHIDGCALGGNQISKQQAMLLNTLQKPLIVVPDRDKAGRELMHKALELEWQVSLPNWSKDCKDIDDAVAKYGRLYTLHSIVAAAEESPLKIKLGAKKWFHLKEF
jgi:hypothetical protein